MKSYEEVIQLLEKGDIYPRENNAKLDDRDFMRLCGFFKAEHLPLLGFSLKEGRSPKEWDKKRKEWKRENFIKELKEDLDFAFEKAYGERGISSALMYEVIKMWLWILDDDLYQCEEYEPYGLPFYKKVAEKYGFINKNDKIEN